MNYRGVERRDRNHDPDARALRLIERRDRRAPGQAGEQGAES